LAGGPGAWDVIHLSCGLGKVLGFPGKNVGSLCNDLLCSHKIDIFGCLLQHRLHLAHVESIGRKNAQQEKKNQGAHHCRLEHDDCE
jgi:hypothetical protein